MDPGFECYTQDGLLQITDKQFYFRLEGKVVAPGDPSGWTRYGGGNSPLLGEYKDFFFNGIGYDDMPMLALSSTRGTWAKLISSSSTSLAYRISRTGSSPTGSPVYIFLFSARRPPNVGEFVLYDENEVPLVSNRYPIVRPLGKYTYDNGYQGVSTAGRSVAHVPQKQGTSRFIGFQEGGFNSCTFQGNPGYMVTTTSGFGEDQIIASPTGTVGLTSIAEAVGPIFYSCNQFSGSAPQGSSFGSGGTRSLIIDVSNM